MVWAHSGPLSLSGAPAAVVSEDSENSIGLLVVTRNAEEEAHGTGVAAISSATAQRLGLAPGGRERAMLELAAGSDAVLTCVVDPSLEGLSIALSETQAYNLHTAPGHVEEFRLFCPPAGEPFELVDCEAEVSVLGGESGGSSGSSSEAEAEEEEGEACSAGAITLDAAALASQFTREYLGRVVAVNEACLLHHSGRRVLLRIASCNTLDASEAVERVGYHCWRGLLAPDTRVYLTTAAGSSGDASGAGAAGAAQQPQQQQGAAEQGTSSSGTAPQSMVAQRRRVTLLNERPRPPAGLSPNTVRILTNDGEEFPVHRKLLRPCIALTSVLRSAEPSPAVKVDVSTSAFDRVLLFLEAQELGREPPAFGIHLAEELAAAAATLGLRPLQEYCQQQLGAAESRLRYYSLEEVRQLNSRKGAAWLIIDGMVLDVGRWLPEHPGGARIIPAQALNIDSARMFEMYHASRESFAYLRQFYCGELLPEDRGALPPPAVPPSPDFLQQLREFTPFRLAPQRGVKNL